MIRPRALCFGASGVGFRFGARWFQTGTRGQASISLRLEHLLMPLPVAATMQHLADKFQIL